MSARDRDRRLVQTMRAQYGDEAAAVAREEADLKRARAVDLARNGNQEQAANFNRAAARLARVALRLA